MTFALLLALALTADDGGTSTVDAGVSATRPNLLRGASVRRSDGIANPAVLADGVASSDADVWNNPRAQVLSKTGFVEWDLGRPEIIAAMRIQADNNDRYDIQGSLDGDRWFPIWAAGGVDLPGVQTRTSNPLTASARFLRMTASGGDGMYSITELEVFDSLAALEGAQLERAALPIPPPPPPPPPFDSGWLVVLAATVGVIWYFRDTMMTNRRRAAEAAAAEAAKNAPPPPEAPKR
ncbi:MAG: hypothetical protein ACO1OB_08780 [Archangium sp.]